MGTLFDKEAIMAIRDSRALLWFGFLLFIWLMQTSINLVLAHNLKQYQINQVFASSLTQVLQFVTAVYFICAFVLRFVFPSFSMEHRTIWILASAPINKEKIFWAKYGFYSLVFVVIGLILGYLNLLTLPLSIIYTGLMLLLFLVTIPFITALGLSLGALFPNYQTADPGVISTTLPGLAFIALSLLYGATGGLLIYYSLNRNSFSALVIFIVGSIVGAGLLLFLTPKLIKNRDLVKTTIS
jgi:ABC-2 type transport system permease protein